MAIGIKDIVIAGDAEMQKPLQHEFANPFAACSHCGLYVEELMEQPHCSSVHRSIYNKYRASAPLIESVED